MRSKNLHRTFLPFACLVLACAVGCGGDDESAPGAASSAGTPEMIKEGDSYRYQGKTRDGQDMSAQIGGEVTLPKDFPGDIPVFPDSKLSATMSAGDHGSMVLFDTPESPDSVHAFYAEKLPNEGWAVDSDAKFGQGHTMAISKDDRTVTLSFSKGNKMTKISLLFGSKP